MPQFHETGYGRKFFEAQLPQLITNIGELTKETKRANNLKEKELESQKSSVQLNKNEGNE